MTSIFNSCAHPIALIIAPGNLPGIFLDLPGLRLFDMPGNGARNGPEKRDRKHGFSNLGLPGQKMGPWASWARNVICDFLCGHF